MDNDKISELNLVSIMHDCFIENQNYILVFETTAKKILEQEKPKLDAPSLWDFFIRILGNNSDKLSEIEKKENYLNLSRVIPNFEGLYLKNVFTLLNNNSKWPEFHLHKNINSYSKIVGIEKVISRINEVYQESIQKEKPVKDVDLIWGWIQPISNILKENFAGINYKLDYDIIDNNKSIFENLVYFKLLELEIHFGKKPFVGDKIINYIEQELKTAKDEIFEEFLDKKLVLSYLEYANLSQNLNENITPSSKMKV